LDNYLRSVGVLVQRRKGAEEKRSRGEREHGGIVIDGKGHLRNNQFRFFTHYSPKEMPMAQHSIGV